SAEPTSAAPDAAVATDEPDTGGDNDGAVGSGAETAIDVSTDQASEREPDDTKKRERRRRDRVSSADRKRDKDDKRSRDEDKKRDKTAEVKKKDEDKRAVDGGDDKKADRAVGDVGFITIDSTPVYAVIYIDGKK